jgi:hypothetical protein
LEGVSVATLESAHALAAKRDAHILVLGAGIAGLSAALMLARLGVRVNVLESKPHFESLGAGLTISGPSFRAIEALGLLDDVMTHGHVHPGIKVHNPKGEWLKTIISPSVHVNARGALPGAGGILRGTLHQILLTHLERLGVRVQMGLWANRIEQDEDAFHVLSANAQHPRPVRVHLNEGQVLEVDAVVLAEGLYASSRERLFPQALKPQFTGQACWRVVLPRPPEIDHRFFYLGGSVKVGLTPVSKDQMYLFLLEAIPENPKRAVDSLPGLLADLLEEFEGPLKEVRESLDARSSIVYRPLESHLLTTPWYQGAVVLVGDAAHATTPQLASGAGMAMEDAIVLSEEFSRASSIPKAWQSYFERRFERCKMVVDNSLKIGELEQSQASAMEQAQWVERSLERLAQPY